MLSIQSQTDGSALKAFAGPAFRQFDFWIGEWDVNLRMKQPDSSWKDAVQSTARIYSILDGKAILELWNENKQDTGIKGYSLRYFNEAKQKWELWLNWPGPNRSGSSSLEGSFRHGRGEFFSESPLDDSTTLISRYTFCDISPSSLRWDDAYSRDGGETWSNNWIMEFSRKRQTAPMFSHDLPILTYDSGKRCNMDQFRMLEQMIGSWTGKIELPQSARDFNAQLDVYKVLDGCAIMTFLEFEQGNDRHKEFSLKTYNTYAGQYEEGILDNIRETIFSVFYGTGDDRRIKTVAKNPISGNEVFRSEWTFDQNQLTRQMFEMVDGKWILVRNAKFSRNP